MDPPNLRILIAATLAAAAFGGCIGSPSAADDPAPTSTTTPAPRLSPASGACVPQVLLAWRHDPDLLPGSVGATTFHVAPDVDALVVDGASGAYISAGWSAKVQDPSGDLVFVIQGRGVTSDAPVNAGSLGGFLGRLLEGILGSEEDSSRTTVPLPQPTASPTPTPVAGALGHRTIQDPEPGVYRFDWATQGIVHGLGVTVTALRCA